MTHDVGYEITFGQMQRETGLGIKGVRASLAELQSKGWLIMERTQKPNGQLGPYRYTLIETTVPRSTVAAATVAKEPDIKKNKDKEEQKSRNLSLIEEQFNEFWKEYPKAPKDRTERKQDAFKEFKSALHRASFEDILAAAIAYRNDPRENRFKLIAHKWLRNDGWEDAAAHAQAEHQKQERRERELAAAFEYIQEMQVQEAKAKPAPKCPHGQNVALCKACLQS